MICLVTAGGSSDTTRTLATIAGAARAGADLIQIREPALDDRALVVLVRGAMAAAAGTGAQVVVNDRVDIALAAGADGVHLRGTSFAAARVRGLVPGGFLIGRSVHTVAEAVAAEQQGGCDYLVFGTVFSSRSKPDGHAVAGAEALRSLCAAVTLPVLAIGGLTPANAGLAARAGAAGVAAIGVFAEAEDIASVVRAFGQAFVS